MFPSFHSCLNIHFPFFFSILSYISYFYSTHLYISFIYQLLNILSLHFLMKQYVIIKVAALFSKKLKFHTNLKKKEKIIILSSYCIIRSPVCVVAFTIRSFHCVHSIYENYKACRNIVVYTYVYKRWNRKDVGRLHLNPMQIRCVQLHVAKSPSKTILPRLSLFARRKSLAFGRHLSTSPFIPPPIKLFRKQRLTED